jgi:signal transduction histidine kinase
MRDFVRKRPPSPSLLNIGEILEETLDFFLPLAERQGVKLDYSCDMPLPRVSADRIQIEEVLLNLLQNAVDAVKDTDERRVRLSASVVDDVLMVSVQDTGPGMSQETCEHLFEAFYTTKPEGLGLGLSLCRSIVEAHGGRLTGENLPEGGTMLSFSLPIAQE